MTTYDKSACRLTVVEEVPWVPAPREDVGALSGAAGGVRSRETVGSVMVLMPATAASERGHVKGKGELKRKR